MDRSKIPISKTRIAELKFGKPSPVSSVTRSVVNTPGDNDQNGLPATPSMSNGRVKRKQWVLHDGPNGSLQRLRLRMAEEGCSHSQVALAKQYLAEENHESDQIAVHWLLKAADQGHFEGLEILRSCLETNRGITESNFHKIRNLLEMSRHERAARLGAKTLFSNIAQGSDFVTTHQLEHWLQETLAKQNFNQTHQEEENHDIDSASLILGGELLSEQHLVSAASDYAVGHFPPLLRLLDLGSKQKFTYICNWLTHNLLNVFAHHLSPPLIVSIMISLTLLNNSLEVLLNLEMSSMAIILVWVLALATAVTFTAQLSCLVRDWNVFHGWSILLSQHAQQLLEPAIPENLYIVRTFPNRFARLLIATVPCVSLQPALHLIRTSLPQPGLWIPYGELGVLASLLCSTCLYSCFRIGLKDLLCLCCWVLWRVEISVWSSFSNGEDNAEENITNNHVFHPALSIRFPTMAIVGFTILVFLYIHRLRQFSSFSHFLAWSVPHFSGLVWLFLAIEWLKTATFEEVLRGIVICVAAILLRYNCSWLTKANLLLCCLTSYSTGSIIGLTPWIALGIVILLIVIIRLSVQFVLLTSQRYWISELLHSFSMRWPQNVWTAVKAALLVACLATLSFRCLTYFKEKIDIEHSDSVLPAPSTIHIHPNTATGGRIIDDNDLDPESTQLTWEHYRKYCYNPSASSNKMTNAATQLACSTLDGVIVDWEGVVREISIDSQQNWVEYFVRLLPSRWAEWLTCRIGEKWSECDQNESEALLSQSFESKRCQILRKINMSRGRFCHLNRFSKYHFRFEVEPKVPNTILLASLFDSKLTIDLLAKPEFQAYGLRLSPGHVIRFQGSLSVPRFRNLKPEVELSSLECLSCQNDENLFVQPNKQFGNPSSTWPDISTFATSTLQGAANFILPHFIRLNVTQLLIYE